MANQNLILYFVLVKYNQDCSTTTAMVTFPLIADNQPPQLLDTRVNLVNDHMIWWLSGDI